AEAAAIGRKCDVSANVRPDPSRGTAEHGYLKKGGGTIPIVDTVVDVVPIWRKGQSLVFGPRGGDELDGTRDLDLFDPQRLRAVALRNVCDIFAVGRESDLL